MTPQWTQMNQSLRGLLNVSHTVVFTALMVIVVLIPILLFWGTAKLAQHLTANRSITAAQLFKAFAYSLIPIALFYHLAHNCMHFFTEAQHVIPLLSDPFGFGWDLFGTARKSYPPIMSLSSIWCLQVICIVVGHLYGVLLADRYARNLYQDSQSVSKSLLPLLATMIFFSSFSVWLIMQPMDMRSAM